MEQLHLSGFRRSLSHKHGTVGRGLTTSECYFPKTESTDIGFFCTLHNLSYEVHVQE